MVVFPEYIDVYQYILSDSHRFVKPVDGGDGVLPLSY
jgi:hypothetical protein